MVIKMKIINKGKYTKTQYICENCECEFEIDGEDINCETYFGVIEPYSKRILSVMCPECKSEIIIAKEEQKYDSSNNN